MRCFLDEILVYGKVILCRKLITTFAFSSSSRAGRVPGILFFCTLCKENRISKRLFVFFQLSLKIEKTKIFFIKYYPQRSPSCWYLLLHCLPLLTLSVVISLCFRSVCFCLFPGKIVRENVTSCTISSLLLLFLISWEKVLES